MPEKFSNTIQYTELKNVLAAFENAEKGIKLTKLAGDSYRLYVNIRDYIGEDNPISTSMSNYVIIADLATYFDTSAVVAVWHATKKNRAANEADILAAIKNQDIKSTKEIMSWQIFPQKYNTYNIEYNSITQIRHHIENAFKNFDACIKRIPKKFQEYERQIALRKFKNCT